MRPSTPYVILIAMLALGLILPSAPADEIAKPDEPVDAELRAGKAMRAGALMVVPIVREKKQPVLAIRAGVERAHDLAIAPADSARHAHAVRIANTGDRPVFMPAGLLLTGGTRDQMIAQSTLIAPHKSAVVPSMPAAYDRRQYEKQKPFAVTNLMAPAYLREMAAFDPSKYRMRALLKRFAALIPADVRATTPLSLAALSTSKHMEAYCVACEADVRSFEKLIDANVVGFATFIHGRLQAFELYGSNAVLQAHFEATLRAHAFKAAALSQHAQEMGIPLHDDGAREGAIRRAEEQVAEVIRDLDGVTLSERVGQPEGTEGTSWRLRSHRARGTLLMYGKRLVHLALYVHDPYEDALYSRTLDTPDVEASEADDFVSRKNRERRARRNRLLPDGARKRLEDARPGDELRDRLRGLGSARPRIR